MTASPNGRTPLAPADYWQLRAVTMDGEVAQARLELARARRQALWVTLAAQYGLAPEGAYHFVDDGCQLVEAAVPPPQGMPPPRA